MKRKCLKSTLLFGAVMLCAGCSANNDVVTWMGSSAGYVEPTEMTSVEVTSVAPMTSIAPETETAIVTEAQSTEVVVFTTSSEEDPIYKHKIVLDPGHGGGEHGAVYNGFREKELTIKVGLFLRDYLLNNYSDVDVVMTRTEDVQFSEDAKEDLQARCDVAANVGAEYLISLHFNADGNMHNNAGSLICSSCQAGLREQGEALGNMVLEQLGALGLGSQGIYFRESDTYFYPDGRPMDYYAINRHCAEYGIPSIIIEHAFIDNPSESIFFESDEKLMALAEADGLAIAQYFGLTPINN